MEILSTFNLFNKKHNISSKKLANNDQSQITMKLLEDKLFSLSIDHIRKPKLIEKTNSQLYLNEQLEECFQPSNKEEKKSSKSNKISLSTAILKYEFEKRKKSKGFLPALLDNKLSCSFPNLSNLLISMPIITDNLKHNKYTEDIQNKIISENMNEDSTTNIKSLILLNGKKPKAKAKYRDEEGL